MRAGSQLRISGGEAGGRVLRSGRGLQVRPTPASIREALGDILRERLPGAVVLDLFAGYGSLGLELLSRGAAQAVFVEQDARALSLLRENVALLGYGQRCVVRRGNVATVLDQLAGEGRRYDLVFVDPPYERGLAVDTLARLGVRPGLYGAGLVVVQHSGRERLPEVSGRLRRSRERVTGDTVVSFYRAEQEEQA